MSFIRFINAELFALDYYPIGRIFLTILNPKQLLHTQLFYASFAYTVNVFGIFPSVVLCSGLTAYRVDCIFFSLLVFLVASIKLSLNIDTAVELIYRLNKL